jgi:alpha-D-xyloside xylohydrolase
MEALPHRPRHQFFNVYPLFHTAAFYSGFRTDLQTALILARDSYLGAQQRHHLWSSDISGNWDTLKRQMPTGINFVASGMLTGAPISAAGSICLHTTSHDPRLCRSIRRRENIGHYDDYPELCMRCRIWRISTQPAATAAAAKRGLVLRQTPSRFSSNTFACATSALMPFYSLAHDPRNRRTLYARPVYGLRQTRRSKISATLQQRLLLVAPVVEQGRNPREVYLPAGSDW